MDVMQKILIGKLSNPAHVIFTNGCLYQYHLISDTWATANNTILLYPGCVYMLNYDYISRTDPQIRWNLLHDTFQIGIKFVG